MRKAVTRLAIVACSLAFRAFGQRNESHECCSGSWAALSNKWLTGQSGELRSLIQSKGEDPIKVRLVTNGVFQSIYPSARMFSVNVMRVEGEGRFVRYDPFSLVEDKNGTTVVDSDDSAIRALNSVDVQHRNLAVLAIQKGVSFGELRSYRVCDEKAGRLLASDVDKPVLTNVAPIVITNTRDGSTLEIVFVTMFASAGNRPLSIDRYRFVFREDGCMRLLSVDNLWATNFYR